MFKAGDPVLRKERDRAKELCFQLNQCVHTDTEKRTEIIQKLIGTIKGNYDIISPFYCDYGKHITIGKNFFSNYNCKILDGANVIFGDDVRIGPDCTFCTPNHAMQPEMRKDGYMVFKPIHVGDNVWFGAGVLVLPGVTIGDNSVIGAGSVVTRDIPSGVLAVGNPCTVIKTLE